MSKNSSRLSKVSKFGQIWSHRKGTECLTAQNQSNLKKIIYIQGGIYWFQIVDYYAAALSLMYIAFFETAAIVWVYGAKRLSSNVKDMTGKYPNIFFRVCWYVVSPLLILVSRCCFPEWKPSRPLNYVNVSAMKFSKCVTTLKFNLLQSML